MYTYDLMLLDSMCFYKQDGREIIKKYAAAPQLFKIMLNFRISVGASL